jgi:hypothetical protein
MTLRAVWRWSESLSAERRRHWRLSPRVSTIRRDHEREGELPDRGRGDNSYYRRVRHRNGAGRSHREQRPGGISWQFAGLRWQSCSDGQCLIVDHRKRGNDRRRESVGNCILNFYGNAGYGNVVPSYLGNVSSSSRLLAIPMQTAA